MTHHGEEQAMFIGQTIQTEDVDCPGCGGSHYNTITRTYDYDYFTTDIPFTVVRCRSCDLLYLNPRPLLSEISKIYPKEYSAYHFNNIRNPIIRKARNYMQSRKARRILNYISASSESPCILDVGCGSPALLSLIHHASSKPIELYGNDFNPDIMRDVREAGFKTVDGNLENVDWQEKFFDVIVMNQVIEHLFDVTTVLRKIHQLLKDGGILFIETPSDEGIDAHLFSHYHWGGYHVPRHLLIFNPKTIDKTLRRCGFVVDKVEYNPSPNFWTSSLRNLLIRKGFPSFITQRMNYKNIAFMMFFTVIDVLSKFFHPTSNMRIIARKQTK